MLAGARHTAHFPIVLFSQELLALLNAGLSVVEALEALLEKEANSVVNAILQRLLTCLMISLWGGSIRFTVPMLWAVAFIPMFGFGGLTGLPLAFNMIDLYLHDTYYVIGHFHYVVAPGTIFAMFGGIYHWFPKMTGKQLNPILGHLHFWPSLICMNLISMLKKGARR